MDGFFNQLHGRENGENPRSKRDINSIHTAKIISLQLSLEHGGISLPQTNSNVASNFTYGVEQKQGPKASPEGS